jgi:poly(3-hydroxybutyrate) depolymerase
MKTNKVILFTLALIIIVVAACSVLFFKSSGCGTESGFTTGEHKIISNDIERVFYLKLPENYNADTSYPLIFAFHGFTSDYTTFSEGYYDLQEVVGEEAILVYRMHYQ